MPGPRPTPTKILNARGSWRAKERDGEVQFPEGKPTCPDWLSAEAKAEWKRQIADLDAAGIVCKVDRAMLALYCDAWGEVVTLTARITEATTNAQNEPGGANAAMLAAINAGLYNLRGKAIDRLMKIADRFGFSPSARARLKGPEAEEEQATGKARFFA